MKRIHSFIVLLVLIGSQSMAQGQEADNSNKTNSHEIVGQGASQGKAEVTYIANEGFLVASSECKILVDALFGGIKGNWCEQPGVSLLNTIINGQPPFDNIDVVLSIYTFSKPHKTDKHETINCLITFN